MAIHVNLHTTRFVDAHVHIRTSAGMDSIASAGIVAVRDGGMKANAAQGATGNKQQEGPIVVSARWALYKKGGYGSPFGVPVEKRAEITAEIDRLRNAGAGIIKVMASGLVSLKDPGRVTAGGFDTAELSFIVQKAAERGLSVMAHANGERAILASATAGVRSIEHGFFMNERALDMMARKGTFWVPTVGALKRAATVRDTTPEAQEFVGGLIQRHLALIQRAHTIGVSLAVGTDCVLPDPAYQDAYNAELLYFEQAGIGRDETIQIASENGAMLLGI